MTRRARNERPQVIDRLGEGIKQKRPFRTLFPASPLTFYDSGTPPAVYLSVLLPGTWYF